MLHAYVYVRFGFDSVDHELTKLIHLPNHVKKV